MKANKNADKLNENAKEAKKLMEEGRAIMRRVDKRIEKSQLLCFISYI